MLDQSQVFDDSRFLYKVPEYEGKKQERLYETTKQIENSLRKYLEHLNQDQKVSLIRRIKRGASGRFQHINDDHLSQLH
jgi:hypothetical protein